MTKELEQPTASMSPHEEKETQEKEQEQASSLEERRTERRSERAERIRELEAKDKRLKRGLSKKDAHLLQSMKLREALEDFRDAREKLVQSEADKKKIKGLRGVLGIEKGAQTKEERDAIDKEYEESKENYELKRAEYIGEKVNRKLNEESRLAEEHAEAYNKEKGEGSKFYNAYKKLGKWNLGMLIKEKNMEKILKKVESKESDDDAIKAAKWIARNGFKFATNVLSVRTAISFSMFAGGLALGGLGAGGAALGVITARRALIGGGTAFGAYDLMKMFGEKKERKKGMKKELSSEELKKMSLEEITERMEYFEINTELNGGKLKNEKAYKTLKYEFNQRARAGKVEQKIDELIEATEKGLTKTREKEKIKELKRKGIAYGIGTIIGTGTLAKGVGVIKDLFTGGAQAAEAGAEIAAEAGVEEIPAETAAETPEAGAEIIPEKAPEHLDYQDGDSIWKEIENQMDDRSAFKEWYASADEAERTHAIDYIKDKIIENPQEYFSEEYLPADVDNVTSEQLENLNWDKAFAECSSAEELNKAIPELTEEAKQSIIENNKILTEYVSKTSEAIDSSTVDQLLTDIKDADSVDQYLQNLETVETVETVEAAEAVDAVEPSSEAGPPSEEVLTEAGEEYWEDLTDKMNEALTAGDEEQIKALILGAIENEPSWTFDEKQTQFFLRALEGNDGAIGKDFGGLIAPGNEFNKDTLDIAIEYFKEKAVSGELPDSDMWTPRYIYDEAGQQQLVNMRNVGSRFLPKYEIDYTADGLVEDGDLVKGFGAKKELANMMKSPLDKVSIAAEKIEQAAVPAEAEQVSPPAEEVAPEPEETEAAHEEVPEPSGEAEPLDTFNNPDTPFEDKVSNLKDVVGEGKVKDVGPYTFLKKDNDIYYLIEPGKAVKLTPEIVEQLNTGELEPPTIEDIKPEDIKVEVAATAEEAPEQAEAAEPEPDIADRQLEKLHRELDAIKNFNDPNVSPDEKIASIKETFNYIKDGNKFSFILEDERYDFGKLNGEIYWLIDGKSIKLTPEIMEEYNEWLLKSQEEVEAAAATPEQAPETEATPVEEQTAPEKEVPPAEESVAEEKAAESPSETESAVEEPIEAAVIHGKEIPELKPNEIYNNQADSDALKVVVEAYKGSFEESFGRLEEAGERLEVAQVQFDEAPGKLDEAAEALENFTKGKSPGDYMFDEEYQKLSDAQFNAQGVLNRADGELKMAKKVLEGSQKMFDAHSKQYIDVINKANNGTLGKFTINRFEYDFRKE